MRTLVSTMITGLLVAGAPAVAGPAVDDPPPVAELPIPLRSLNRQLRFFGFEEAETTPHTLPIHFYRFADPDGGYPLFGSVQLTREVAHGGRWSFGFDLDGGSLSAQVPTAVLPVLPGADYVISAWVRTEGLRNARAQVRAMFTDANGSRIPASLVVGPLLRTKGVWQETVLEIHGNFPEATDLIIDLRLMQPDQYLGMRGPHEPPRIQDIHGRAWFDDVAVWQRPRVDLSTDAPGNVLEPEDEHVLHLLVRDVLPDRLTAELAIRDATGRLVHKAPFELPQGVWNHAISLETFDPGWYQAILRVANADQIVGARELNFVIQPAFRHAGIKPKTRFGLEITPESITPTPRTTTQLVRRIGATGVALPVGVNDLPDRDLHAMTRDLLGRGVELTLVIHEAPAALVRELGADPTQVFDLLRRHPDRFQHLFSGISQSLGLEVPRWLIGPPGALDVVPPDELFTLLEEAKLAIEKLVPAPLVLAPFFSELAPTELPVGYGHWVVVPNAVPPPSLAAYAQRWPFRHGHLYVQLERLSAESFTPIEQVSDLVLRGLWAWRAGLPHIVIKAPWSRRDEPTRTVMPEPTFAAWRVLSDMLAGRSFGGELPLGNGLRCWILTGATGEDDAALVAWNESALESDAVIRIRLADGPVDVVDPFGVRRRVVVEDGRHVIPLTSLPVFIEGVDDRLARFRASVRIEPVYVPARHQVHEAAVIMDNPWPIAISGSIQLDGPSQWRIKPRVLRFTIPSLGTMRKPLSIILGRGALAGETHVDVTIDLVADQDYRINTRADLEIGLENIEFTAHWQVVGRDVVITQIVTNAGSTPMELQAYVSAPNLSQQRRPFALIEPGETAVRRFPIKDGVLLLSDRQVHVGITEKDGNARLNRVLIIPPLK